MIRVGVIYVAQKLMSASRLKSTVRQLFINIIIVCFGPTNEGKGQTNFRFGSDPLIWLPKSGSFCHATHQLPPSAWERW